MADNVNRQMEDGKITRVSGPIVEARGMSGARMYEVVEVGPDRLVSEVIKVDGDRATVQVYEYTGGVKPGMLVRRLGRPLSLSLGPGLIGSIYDGIQHPLEGMRKESGAFIQRGQSAPPIDMERRWEFVPTAEEGDEISEGECYASLPETGSVEHRLMVPPGISGRVRSIAERGEYRAYDPVCVIEDEGGSVHDLSMVQVWPVRTMRPFQQRVQASEPLITGQRVFDTMFPLAKGGCAGVPGDFGTGKTIIQQQLAKWSDADVVVYVGCGERGNEMTDILREFPKLDDPRSGRSLMERTILIANTSNMPVAAREVSIYTGITIAEYYRDMGYDVALMADSTSRWAEALREMSSRLEEMPVEEGFPAYLSHRLAQFYERAGAVRTLGGANGSVSIIGSVSPPGGDFSEPVTQHTTRFTRCFWVLDRELAYARHFPSVNWNESYSEYVEQSAKWWRDVDRDWFQLRETAMEVLQKDGELQEIVQLVGSDVLPDTQRLVLLAAEIIKEGFLQQNAFHEVDSFCDHRRQAAFLSVMVEFYNRGRSIISAGAPLMEVRELGIVQKLKRARFSIKNGDEDGLKKLKNDFDSEFGQLEAKYR